MLKSSLLFTALMCATTMSFASETTEDGKPTQSESSASAKSDTTADATEKVEAVEVRGVKDPEWKPYRVMLKGLDAFDKYHHYAPNAEPQFMLRPQVPNIAMGDVQVRIAGDDISIPIPISEKGLFSIPRNQAAADENAEMVLNQKKHSVLWRPYIHSPGLAPNVMRLGDLRLECEITWAVAQDDLPFLIRNMFRLGGGLCNSSRINYSVHVPRQVVAVTMVSNETKKILPIWPDGTHFDPPLFDHKWNDDTLIELQFSDQAAAENTAIAK
jgi:hypothetical protein